MGDDRAADLLAVVRALEARDLDIASRLEEVRDVLRRVDDARAKAGRVRALLAALPAEAERLSQIATEAVARESAARSELADAERRLGEVGRSRRAGEDARAEAERAVRRAATAAADAAVAAARAQERLRAFADEELALRAEGEGVAVEARDAAAAVAAVPRLSDSGRSVPGSTLEEIEEWGARAHAALFVVRGGLENERERVVLEAVATAAAALGDDLAGSSVALVRKRLEQALS